MPGAKARLRLDGADPINRGLLGFWPLAENGGLQATDLSPYSGQGTLGGTPSRIAGLRGRAVQFSGAQNITSTRAQGLTAFSASAWVLMPSGSGFDKSVLSSMRVADNTILFSVSSSGTALRFWASTASSEANATGFTSIDGRWAHIGVSWTPTSRVARFFLDGRYIGGGSTGADVVSPITGWSIGRYGVPNTWFFNGAANNVRAWGRTLSDAEFRRLHREPWAGTGRLPRRSVQSTAASPIAGTLAATLANVTSDATGALPIRGSLAKTLAATTSASTGALAIAGTLAQTLGNATLAATGRLAIAGAVSATLADVGLVATNVVPAVPTPAGGRRSTRGARRIYLPEPAPEPEIVMPSNIVRADTSLPDDDEEAWILLS